MSTHKNIDRICAICLVIAMLLTAMLIKTDSFGIETEGTTFGYETRLFDQSTVHTINIEMADWDSFIANATSEEYAACTLTIDGKEYRNIAIRAKGNTSLSSVAQYGNNRYSFKVEFDHYDDNQSYYGLDKLCLNNIIQDNTYMKDYLTYTLMGQFGVTTPLVSYTYITVNGEDFGLYLAVEGVEDSFLERNYGTDTGNLYKPDSMSMGGGRGNGKDFDFDQFQKEQEEEDAATDSTTDDAAAADESKGTEDTATDAEAGQGQPGQPGQGQPPTGRMPGGSEGQMPEGFEGQMPEGFDDQVPDFSNGEMPSFPGGSMPGTDGQATGSDSAAGNASNTFGDFGGFAGFGMGQSDVKLQYIDDDIDSYSNIFDSAKTNVKKKDKEHLIASLKSLSENEDLEEVLDVEEVIRYFVIHNYVVNGDSYTGSMIHNFYLHEKDGQLSMIPWDYNLAFGGFSGTASSVINDAIDTPLSIGSGDSRPMADWILENEEYTELYHQYLQEFLDSFDLVQIIDDTYELIKPYVEKDPTAFCTYDEFEKGVSTLKSFCELRSESVQGQLDGTIPSTDVGQQADSSTMIDASSINISDMGSMGGGMGGGFGGGFGGGSSDGSGDSQNGMPDMSQFSGGAPGGGQPPQGGSGDGQSGMPDMSSFQGEAPGNFPGAPGQTQDKPAETAVTAEDETESDGVQEAAAPGEGGNQNGPGNSGNPGSMPSDMDFPGFGDPTAGGYNISTYMMTACSVGVLIIGLGFAFIYRRKRKI